VKVVEGDVIHMEGGAESAAARYVRAQVEATATATLSAMAMPEAAGSGFAVRRRSRCDARRRSATT